MNNPFSFDITASDMYSTSTCHIEVSYQSMNTPPFIISSTFSIPYFSLNNTYVGTAIAYDLDYNQTLSFSITSLFGL